MTGLHGPGSTPANSSHLVRCLAGGEDIQVLSPRTPTLTCSATARDHGISRVTAYWYLDEVITVLAERAPDLAEAQNRRHHPRRPRPHPLRAQLHHMKFVEITSMSRGV